MIKVGIFFGGTSREREVSFAGGRTVYDNLDKSLFEAIPLFVDPWGNICELKWEFIYKGSIRDFYPPVEALQPTKQGYQIYAESLGNLNFGDQLALLQSIGKPITIETLKSTIDIAFLALHGTKAEDGTIQGLLEWAGIPYTGSGILPSAIGINKSVQKIFQQHAGFRVPEFYVIQRADWICRPELRKKMFDTALKTTGIPCVVKSANQGSSIGISVLEKKNFAAFETAVNKSFFILQLEATQWNAFSQEEKKQWIRTTADIREGLGMPVQAAEKTIHHPGDLYKFLDKYFQTHPEITIEALQQEQEVLLESFISGQEFSCIVIENEAGMPLALPPTQIVKNKEVFDYRSKYLPGLSRKITPIELPANKIKEIRKDCAELFKLFRCGVYARIDGFVTPEGTIYLNDPNTTSGMMPSSFFFHQAAEIGLNPSRFLTYILRTSLARRSREWSDNSKCLSLLKLLDHNIQSQKSLELNKIRVAVILGGYSSERHISVESGRNIYEKLASSTKYQPFPVFLTGTAQKFELYKIPVNIMLKDNADDIREKILHYRQHPILEEIKKDFKTITETYAGSQTIDHPEPIALESLHEHADRVFIALHGRPGEDGELQKFLVAQQLPFNGSGIESSAVTINKFDTNNLLREHGFPVADSMLVQDHEWTSEPEVAIRIIQTRIGFPLIAKPADDGCSSAVKKINSQDELRLYAAGIFRTTDALPETVVKGLKLMPKEEFPRKNCFLIEKLIRKDDQKHFLEITGGLLTSYNQDGTIKYEIFEPSETLAEGAILSLEEKFLAGEGQNITPARFDRKPKSQKEISKKVRQELKKAAKILKVEGYARIDAFVKIYNESDLEVNIIEINSLPGMTPATCIFHQCALNGYKPYDFIDRILEFGYERMKRTAAP